MLTTKIGVTVAVLALAFGVTFATFSVASLVGPVTPAHAAADDGDENLDEDDCEALEDTYNEAVKVGSNERAAGNWAGWNLMQTIAEETYLDAQFGGCEWAAEAAPSTGRTPAVATQDVGGYGQWLPVGDYRVGSVGAHFTDRSWARGR
jgi:hypothetical protein